MTPDRDRATSPSAASQALVNRLSHLRLRAGKPSSRKIAADTGRLSHTTIAEAFSGRRLPSWEALEAIIEALNGDTKDFRLLWADAVGENALQQGGDQFVSSYREHLVRSFGQIDVADLKRRRRASIEDVYVTQRVAREIQDGRVAKSEDADLLRLVTRNKRVVLLGDPGHGKTTACHNVVYQSALNVDAPLPFFLPIRVLEKLETSTTRSLISAIEQHVTASLHGSSPPKGYLAQATSQGKTLVILDGVDEVLDPASRREIATAIETFCRQFPNANVIVTSRVAGYAESQLDPRLFTTYLLQGFGTDQVRQYIQRWFAAQIGGTELDASTAATTLLAESAHFQELLSSPLMLSLICAYYRGHGYIPRHRVDLYAALSEISLSRWDSSRGIESPFQQLNFVEPVLQLVAYRMLNGELGPVNALPRKAFIREVSMFLGRYWIEDQREAVRTADDFASFLTGRSGVFIDVGIDKEGEALFAFAHRTFLEYFAGSHIARILQTPADFASFILNRVSDSTWNEAILVAFQIFDSRMDQGAELVLSSILEGYSKVESRDRPHVLGFISGCQEIVTLTPTFRRLVTEFLLTHSDSDAQSVSVVCARCGAILDERSDVPLIERKPCPECSSRERRFDVVLTDSIFPSAAIETRTASVSDASS